MNKINEREDRLKKLDKLKKIGIDPYPAEINKKNDIADILKKFAELLNKQKEIKTAGRIRGKRAHGNLIFIDLEDATGKIQAAFSKKEIGADNFKIFDSLIDIGDFIEITGKCFLTHKQEKTIMVKAWRIICKALRPLPEKWHGLADEEEKLRKRYLDILTNNEVKQLFIKKSIFWQAVREFMTSHGFLEVETPVLEITAGGADAKPFVTHHRALNLDLFLRISMGELWQKRLIVAGYEKIFEIGRQFRNEGMDAEHLQDYTQMEFYWAYTDIDKTMDLVKELFQYTAYKTFSTLNFKIKNFTVDLNAKWQKYDYRETVAAMTGIDIANTNQEQIEKKLKQLNIEYEKEGFNLARAIDNLWKYCRKQIAGPGFLIGAPIIVSPLAKRDPLRPELSLRFQPIIGGTELGNGYSELNDPLDQAERFLLQQKMREAGDEEAQMFDSDFIEALEYGLPPTCGFGMSERVFSVLAGKTARECQFFPLMKPKNKYA